MRQSYLTLSVQNREVFLQTTPGMTGRCWFNFLVLYWQCEPGTNAFFCILSYILTLRYVTSGLKSNQTRTTASWSLETRRSKLHLSMLHLTHSACPLDSEISGCSKHCDKHASPKIQLLYCLYNQCGLVFLALCLMLQLLWSFEKEKSTMFEQQGTTVVLLPHPRSSTV